MFYCTIIYSFVSISFGCLFHFVTTAKEFVLYDESEITTEMISDEEILKAVQPNNQEKEEVEEEPLPTITHNEVIECYDKVILYLQHQEKIIIQIMTILNLSRN